MTADEEQGPILPADLQKPFNRIRLNEELGSRELVLQLLETLRGWAGGKSRVHRETLRTVCRAVIQLRPEMTALQNAGYLLWNKLNTREVIELKDILNTIHTMHDRVKQVPRRLLEQARSSMDEHQIVMTFSRSSTVLEVIENLEGIHTVHVLHSYPGGEGIGVARRLQPAADVTFHYDTEAGALFTHSDLDGLYVGGDTLYPDGSVLNKTGTCLLARASGTTPTYCFMDAWKVRAEAAGGGGPTTPSPEGLPRDLQQDHPVFERTPGELLDGYVTDRGFFENVEELHEAARDILEAQQTPP